MKKILTILVLLSCIACNRSSTKESNQAKPQKSRPVSANDNPVVTAQPAEMRMAMFEVYRLKPDQRFLMAVSDIHHILTGQPRETGQAQFDGTQWNIRYKNSLIGTVPELPDFSDFLSCLSSWSRQLAKQYPLSSSTPSDKDSLLEAGIQDFFSRDEINVLRRIDSLWLQKKSPYLLYSATRATVRLNLQSLDRLQIADIVPAHALALLALSKSLTTYDLKAEEALLSQSMGYSGFADKRASELAPDDPVRLFVTQDYKLGSLAAKQDAPVQVRYLWLIQVSHHRDPELWEQTRNSLFSGATDSLAVVKTGMDIEREKQMEARPMEYLPPQLCKSLLKEMANKERSGSGALDALDPATVKAFESEVETAIRGTGPFADSDMLRAFYRGYFYSAFHWIFKGYPYQPVAIKEGPFAAEYDRWLADYQEINQANPPVAGVVADMTQLTILGAPALTDLADRFFQNTSFDSPQIPRMARLLAARLDTRVKARLDLGFSSLYRLFDRGFTGKLCRSILSSSSPDDPAAARCAVFEGDVAMIRNALRSKRCDMKCSSDILYDWAFEDALHDDEIQTEYERLVAQYPHAWNVASTYIDFLRKHKLYAKAVSVTDQWLRANNDPAGVGYFHAHIRQARNCYLAGQYKQGLAVLEPIKDRADSFSRGVVHRETALLLEALGRKEEALALAREAPNEVGNDRETILVLAQILWKNGSYDEAADVVQSVPMNPQQFYAEARKPFFDAFKDRPAKDAIDAVAALRKKHLAPVNLMGCAAIFDEEGRTDVAFQIQASLQPGASVDEDVAIEAFRYLKKWKGEKEATQWLDRLLPHERRNPLSVKFLYGKEYGLLWDFIGDPNPKDHPDYVWFCRADASALIGPDKDPHRQELLNYYRRTDGDLNYQSGRYLIGLIGEKELFPLVKTADDRSAISHCIGTKAEGEGRYEDASDWYRVAIETGVRHELSWHLSFRKITSWPRVGFWALRQSKSEVSKMATGRN